MSEYPIPPKYRSFGPDFTLGQCGEVFERHNLPCKSLCHGPDTFDVADALLRLSSENTRLREALELCDIHSQVANGHIGTPAYEKICAALAEKEQPR